MQSLNKTFFFALAIVLTSFAATAGENPTSKIVENAKQAVANAETDFADIYAQSAEICLMKNENMELAYEWVEIAVALKETAYNLEVKADFLAAQDKKEEAKKLYHRALVKSKEQNPTAENAKLQQKLWNLR